MRKNFIVVLVVAMCVPWFTTTVLWRNEKHRHQQTVQSLNEWLERHRAMDAKSWWIMVSYGLVDRQVTVTVGHIRVDFVGTREWEDFAQTLGPATVVTLHSKEQPEHVTATVDGNVIFDGTLDPAAGPFIVIERNQDKSFSVQQLQCMVYE